jgi:hypothetical protein
MKARKALLAMLAILCLFGCEKLGKLAGGEKGIAGVYEDLEEAYRTGDGKLWLSLQSKEALIDYDQTYREHIEKNGIPPRPNMSMDLTSSMKRSDKAALFVKYVDEQGEFQYEALRLVLEDGGWKISEMEAGNRPIYPHTFFPPEDGAFMKSGANWGAIPYALASDSITTLETPNWSMKGALDESFLYIRLEGKEVLPEPGSELSGPGETAAPALPFSIDITVSSTSEGTPLENRFRVAVSEGLTTWTTFDETGRADQTTYYLNYSFTLYDQESTAVFTNSTTASNPLIKIEDRQIDLMIPRPSLRFGDEGDLTVTLGSNSYFKTYTVQRFD